MNMTSHKFILCNYGTLLFQKIVVL